MERREKDTEAKEEAKQGAGGQEEEEGFEFEGSEFGSLEGDEKKEQTLDTAKQGKSKKNNAVISKISESLGQEGSTSNPLAFESKSVKTETIKEEEISQKNQDQDTEIRRPAQKQRYFEDAKNVKCFKCGKTGHFRSMCPDTTKVHYYEP